MKCNNSSVIKGCPIVKLMTTPFHEYHGLSINVMTMWVTSAPSLWQQLTLMRRSSSEWGQFLTIGSLWWIHDTYSELGVHIVLWEQLYVHTYLYTWCKSFWNEFFVACSQTLLPSLLGLPLQSVLLCMVEDLTLQLDKEIKC
jgi:hypothetical protein